MNKGVGGKTIGRNSHLNSPLQLTSASKIHARSELWFWQDSVEGDSEGRGRDRSMEQPWKEVLLHPSDLVDTMVLTSSRVRSYFQP